MRRGAIEIFQINNVKECVILERINKFVAKIILDGKIRRAYINNTGRLTNHLSKGKRGFCIVHKKDLKTDCRLFAVKEDSLAAVIDTYLQMKALEKIITLNLIPWINGCRILKRNARLNASYIDYLLECKKGKAYLEVKSAVLRSGGYATYPDCPSLRGRRHIMELTEYAERGGWSIILFIAALPDVKAFKPNSSADPKIAELLLKAEKAGVEIRAIEMYYNPEDCYFYLSKSDLPVVF